MLKHEKLLLFHSSQGYAMHKVRCFLMLLSLLVVGNNALLGSGKDETFPLCGPVREQIDRDCERAEQKFVKKYGWRPVKTEKNNKFAEDILLNNRRQCDSVCRIFGGLVCCGVSALTI